MTGNQLLLYRLAELMLEKQENFLLVDDLFDDEQIGDFAKSIQIDSPYQQMLLEGVLTESVRDEKLYVSFTVEGYFHYVLGEVIEELALSKDTDGLIQLVNESRLKEVNEGFQNFLIREVNKGNHKRLFLLIDHESFPLEICIKPLALYFLITNNSDHPFNSESEYYSTFLLKSLLSKSSIRDFQILRLTIKYLKQLNFNLINTLYIQILEINIESDNDDYKILISEAIQSLPVEYITDRHLRICASPNPEIQFELNIDKIRWKRKKNEHQDAFKYITENLSILENGISDIRIDLKSIFFDAISFYYAEVGNYLSAKDASLKALSYLHVNNNGYGVSLNNLALICIDLQEFELSEHYLEEAYKFDTQKFGFYSENAASRLGNFGYLNLLKGDYDKALNFLQQALVIDKRIFGDYHENVATRLLNISDCLRNLGRNSEALASLIQSREIDIHNYGSGHPMLAASYNIEAHIHLREKNYLLAHESINSAIEINKTLNNGINDHINRDFNFQGILYSREGNYTSALESFLTADKIEEKLFNELPQHRLITWINICKTLKNLGTLESNNQYLLRLKMLPDEYTDKYRSDIDLLAGL